MLPRLTPPPPTDVEGLEVRWDRGNECGGFSPCCGRGGGEDGCGDVRLDGGSVTEAPGGRLVPEAEAMEVLLLEDGRRSFAV